MKEVKDGSTLYFHRTEKRGQILFFLGRGLSSLPGGQRLLRPGNQGGAAESGLGEVLPVSLLVEDGLDLVKGPPGSSLHGGVDHGLAGLEGVLRPPGGQDEPENDITRYISAFPFTLFLFLILPLVVGGSADTHDLGVDQAVVSLGVPVGQVAGLGGERLLDAPLLQQEAARLTDDGPGDVRGNHDGYFLLQMEIFKYQNTNTKCFNNSQKGGKHNDFVVKIRFFSVFKL